MSRITDLEEVVKEQALLIEKTHKWLWENLTHARWREQSAKYNELVSYNKSLVGILGFMRWIGASHLELKYLKIETVNDGVVTISLLKSDDPNVVHYEDMAEIWLTLADENYKRHLEGIDAEVQKSAR